MSRLLLGAALAALLLVPARLALAMGNGAHVIIQFLASTGEDPDAKCKLKTKQKGDELQLSLTLENIHDGEYGLFVADTFQGKIVVDGGDDGVIAFETPGFPGGNDDELGDDAPGTLDFDVFGELFEIRRNGKVYFHDVFDAQGPGASDGGGAGKGGEGNKPVKLEIHLVNLGPDPDAQGSVRYLALKPKTLLEVELQHLDDGDDAFTFVVDGTPQASFDTTGLDELTLVFSDPPPPTGAAHPDDDDSDDDDELHFPLDFDPLGVRLEIRREGSAYLAGLLPGPGAHDPPKQGAQAAKDLGKKKADALQVALLDMGVMPGAAGVAVLEQSPEQTRFRVELHDLPDATYAVHVGGAPRGELAVVAGEAALQFASSPLPGELPLDFPVKGELVELLLDDDMVLGALFPISVPAALGKGKQEKVTPQLVRRNLLNAGADLDAWGFVRWKQTKQGAQTLLVRARDLPAGELPVLVDGVPQGALLVKKPGGASRLRFSTAGKGKTLPLDFDVQGALIEVVDAAGAVQLAVELD